MIWQRIKSSPGRSTSTKAGLRFPALRSVCGNGMPTTSPATGLPTRHPLLANSNRAQDSIVMTISMRLKSGRGGVGLVCLGGALFNSARPTDEDAANDPSQHHRHHGGGGGGRYGHEEEQGRGGRFDQLIPLGGRP